MTIQQDIRGGLFGSADVELTQVGEISEFPLASCFENRISAHRANTRDTQQLLSACLHDLNGSFSQVPLRPGPLGIEVELHIPITHEWQILYTPPIIAQQKAGLIEAVRTERVRRRAVVIEKLVGCV